MKSSLELLPTTAGDHVKDLFDCHKEEMIKSASEEGDITVSVSFKLSFHKGDVIGKTKISFAVKTVDETEFHIKDPNQETLKGI